ncbi:hypothetical protein [Spongiibacter marinus]|uniref:hypothetical protein n=1 Tax=Spongiibacter marinus TaxID=354246 RepID=UPI0035BE973F
MLRPHILYTLLCSIVLLSSAAQAEPRHYSYLEAAFAYQSTDWGPYEEEENFTFLASAEAFDYFHVHARYNDGDTYMPRGVIQDGWWTYGIGAHYYLNNSTSVLIGADRHELKSKGKRPNQRGWEYKVGVRHDINARWRLTLEAGEHNLNVSDDTTFIFETLYHPRPDIGFSFRVRDYDKLDLSSYEFGARWSY